MTLDEALRELGIDRSAMPEQARRAYLRGIKAHKPENDPQGFRRLREAYELVSEALAEPWPEPDEEGPPEPPALDAEDRARLDDIQDPDDLAFRAQVHLERSRLQEAAEVLGKALDRLQELSGSEYRPPPVWLPRGILALEAAGETTRARALYRRLRSWLATHGDAELLSLWKGEDVWRMLQELERLDTSFPPELRRAAARAALSLDESPAVAEARRYAELDPEEAEAVSILLTDLPMLQRLYAPTLEGAHLPSRRRQGARGGARKTLARILLLLLSASIVMVLADLLRALLDDALPF